MLVEGSVLEGEFEHIKHFIYGASKPNLMLSLKVAKSLG